MVNMTAGTATRLAGAPTSGAVSKNAATSVGSPGRWMPASAAFSLNVPSPLFS